MARPRNQEARREQLVLAATEAVGRHGLAQLRVADIADAAGVARGSVNYYFSDLGELLQQVYRRAADRFFTDRATLAAALPDARDKLVACARLGLPDGPEDELALVLYEFSSATHDNPVYSTLAQSLFDRQVTLYAGILEIGRAQGHFTLTGPALDLAANLVVLEDGYGLHIISRNASLTPERSLDLLLGHARTVTGCPDLLPDRAVDTPSS
ncbi:TetR/AcrR family transcriptional regulator [Kitasatospora sp. NPDC101183]|uniref:TetR/AcrR family transcriptional regulator n=1 Tax=Kitasatospora sp. NPDC101183 TaxID=3364100 RepID=UPI0038143741